MTSWSRFRGCFIAVVSIVLGAVPALANPPVYLPVVGDPNPSLPFTLLSCPTGQYIDTIRSREGGWLSHLEVFCEPYGWSIKDGNPAHDQAIDMDIAAHEAAIMSGNSPLSIGGKGGDHDFILGCRIGDFISGIGAKTVKVDHFSTDDLHEHHDLYAASPVIQCSTLRGQQALPQSAYDPSFKPDRDYSTVYMDGPMQACPQGGAGIGLRVAIDPARGDIKAAGLVCGLLVATLQVNPGQIASGPNGPGIATTPVIPGGVPHQAGTPVSGLPGPCQTNPALCATVPPCPPGTAPQPGIWTSTGVTANHPTQQNCVPAGKGKPVPPPHPTREFCAGHPGVCVPPKGQSATFCLTNPEQCYIPNSPPPPQIINPNIKGGTP
jgi:hypothetical protein